MKPRLWMLSLLVVLAACQSSEQAPQPSAAASAASPPVSQSVDALAPASYAGYGDMRFGMDEAAFRKAWSGELKGSPAPGSTCVLLTPRWVKTPPEIAFMLEQGHFVRYDVTTAKEAAPGGGKVGMSQEALRALYGDKAKELPDKYDPHASQWRVEGDTGSVLLFEIGADGKVNKWRVGVPPQVDYVEGCS